MNHPPTDPPCPAPDPPAALPIVFVHVGLSDYLPYALAQAKASNPRSRIVLLGDPSNATAGDLPFVEDHLIRDHAAEADQFTRVYRHFNTNPVEYERFCFERWFILHNWMERQGLDRCLYLDSDVMLYSDATAEAATRFAGCALTLSQGTCPACSFVLSRDALGRFCQFLMETYTQPQGLAMLERVYRGQIDRGLAGGACDMACFADYMKRQPSGAIGEASLIVDGSTYDHNINNADGYAQRDGIKDVRFDPAGRPHGWHIQLGRYVRFNTLHFQAQAKARMERFITDVSNLLPRGERYRTKGCIFTSALRPPRPAAKSPLPIHFLTIALDAQPFIRQHIDQFKQLTFDWHWHVIDGAAELILDVQFSVPGGEDLPIAFPFRNRPERSTDGTSEYLDQLSREFPDNITIYRMPPGTRWPARLTMMNAPIVNIHEPCLLWQIDPDELWTAEQLATARQMFLANPDKSAARYWCWFFVGPGLITRTQGGFGNNPARQWIRTWRYRPGMVWAFEPPILCEPVAGGQWRSVAAVNPLTHEQTAQAGLIFQHYAYVLEKQLDLEEWYYGPTAKERWRVLQACTEFPVDLRDYFRWVGEETKVDRAEPYVRQKLLNLAGIDASGRTEVVK